jgi:transposase-like protein
MVKTHLKLVTPTTKKRAVTPRRRPNSEFRSREHLTESEVEKLIEAAKDNRYGHRDATMILVACRREGIAQNLYYRWSKDFLEAGKKRLAGDTARAATSDEVKDLRREAIVKKRLWRIEN